MSPQPFEELGGCDSAMRVMSPFPGQWVKDTPRGRSRPPAGSQGGHADRTAHPQGSASRPASRFPEQKCQMGSDCRGTSK